MKPSRCLRDLQPGRRLSVAADDPGGGPGGKHGPGHHHEPGRGKHGHSHGGGKGPHGPPHAKQTDDLTFLRGTLLTDESGIVEFVTTVPGWYPGRAPHIHMKVGWGSAVCLSSQDDFILNTFPAYHLMRLQHLRHVC